MTKIAIQATYRGAHGRYQARLIVDGAIVGHIRRDNRTFDYKAYTDGLLVARGRTLAELRRDLREWAMASGMRTRWTAYSGSYPVSHGATRSEATIRAKPRLDRGQRITHYVLRERGYPFRVIRTEVP